MARRSFSLMLAWRYLNPRRAMLSAVTIISVTGVLLGVWILVVVMSVFNGLEEQVQKRLLGYTPHIRLSYHGVEPPPDWREISKSIAGHPGVKSTGAYLQDFALVDVTNSGRAPSQATFRAIDTTDPDQVKGIEDILKDSRAKYPDSSADMGLDKKVIISSFVANPLGVGIGDKIRLYSARNFNQVKSAFEISDQPVVRDRYKEQLAIVKGVLSSHFEKSGDDLILIPDESYFKLVDFSEIIMHERDSIREEELSLLDQVLILLEQADRAPEGRVVAAATPGEALEILKQLDTTDRDQMDAKITKRIRELVLPQEAEVIGIYQPGQMAVMPDIFMPLPLAQQLSGLNDGVQAIAVWLDDPYSYQRVSRELMAKLPEDWVATSWYDDFGNFARLINQQRVMMYIVLSMIIVISAFSMMAVMFTVTIQKRREIGVMKALGAAPGQIVRVFLHQGIILGAVGAVLGVGLGLLTLHLRGNLQDFLRAAFNFDPFPGDFNGFDVLPALIVPKEVVLIAVSSFILCSLAAMVPAIFASRSDAAKSLRNL
ncbi:MAG: hypothetical protein JWO82_4221 [Akkermansiaceae bacterium]|nr:hypothetical protein [Akkermansiaceae bacterium]